MAEINLKKLTSGGSSDIDVNFNGTLEGQADATIPLNVNLTDSLGDVTPTSLALTGNDLDILIPDAVVPSGVLFKTIEPSQYTSYQTGDEGWRVQNGFFNYTPPTAPKAVAELDYTNTNFFCVLKTPLVVNGVSSTTRFVDVNGIQAFSATGNANLVVIDKLTGMMYSRVLFGNADWSPTITDVLSYSVTVNSQVYNDWYLCSLNECINIVNQYNSNIRFDTLTGVELFPNLTENIWLSTTNPTITSFKFEFDAIKRYCSSNTRLAGANSIRRLIILNARNLITAP